MQEIVKRSIKKRLAKLCGRAVADAMALESQGADEASAAMRAHAERLGAVLDAYDKPPTASASPIATGPLKPSWGAGTYKPKED